MPKCGAVRLLDQMRFERSVPAADNAFEIVLFSYSGVPVPARNNNSTEKDQGFESGFLQQRVCEPSVPQLQHFIGLGQRKQLLIELVAVAALEQAVLRRLKLHRVLRSRITENVRAAIDGERPGETQAAGVGDRQEIAGGPSAADGLSPAVRHLLATQGQGPEDDRQQRLQRLALRRRLARREIGPAGTLRGMYHWSDTW